MARLAFTFVSASFLLSAAVRSQDLKIADIVKAGQATTASVNVNKDDTGESYSGYRIYLATTPPGWGTGPACYLVNYTDIDVNQVQVTVPASVVPDQTTASLSISEMDSGVEYGESFSYSNDFTLEGGTGEWSALELNGYGTLSPDDTPCTALQCTRDCGNKYYPGGALPDDVSESDSTYQAFYNCTAACPGVTLPSWDQVWSDDGSNGDDGGDSTASTTGAASTQATAQTTQTTSPTPSGSTTDTANSASSTATSAASSKTSGPATSATSVAESSASRIRRTATAILIGCLGLSLGL